MEDVVVETAAEPEGTPPDGGAVAESGAPPEDAQAAAAGADPGGETEPEEWARFLESRGLKGKPFDSQAKATIGSQLYKTFSENKRFSDENAQLRTRLAQLEAAPPAQPAKEPEVPPTLKEFDEYISTLRAELDELPKAESQLVKDLLDTDRKIAIQEALKAKADPLDQPQFDYELSRLRAERGLLSRQYSMVPRDRARVEAEIRRAERDRRSAEQSIQAEESARQEAGEQTQYRQTEFLTTINTLIPQTAKEVIPTLDPTLSASMTESVTDGLTIALWRLEQAGIKQFDIQKLVRDQVEKWAKDRKLVGAAHLKATSRDKQQVARPATPAPRTPTPPNPATQALSAHERWERKKAEMNKGFGW